ncbi:MAG: thioredoxin domain-containing protein [Cyclobacteriaceae bacterium]|nr:thioredoxin domain-containing protein [Cyclobacteriaceae bacterium]
MPNRLTQSTSPYLLQHANNPVDWFEWGIEALTKAVVEDKPILVSIGYSSCHWCHVMERESFEDDNIAKIMNDHFVCIKVDREERPDIDQVYMEAVQAMQQNGGWPLNVFLTPDQKPFFGGTYFPPRNWSHLLLQINQAFREKRTEIDQSATSLREHLQTSDLKRFAKDTESTLNKESLDGMFRILESRFDKTWGGIEKAPKFVMPSIWLFLLRYHAMSRHPESLQMVTHTLKQMAFGGIYDQLAGGFSRYSVDAEWFAPHFEKMLYDNGQLLSLYSEAYSITKEPLFKQVVYQTVDWLTNEMKHPEGGFYSALDADSEGMEGKFYTWTADEIREILGESAVAFLAYYQSTNEGNWEHDRNILRKSSDTQESFEPIEITEQKKKLLSERAKRIHPGLDDKILTGWNAMTIQGLIDAYKAFQYPRFLTIAQEAMSFVEKNLIAEGKAFRAYKNKHSETEGFLEDYAFLIQTYTTLYQVTFNEDWLTKASHWCDYVQQHFYDANEGYFHFASNTAESLIARKKEIFDNVIPSSNAVMARNLFTLGILLDRDDWKQQATGMVSKLSQLVTSEPGYMCHWAVLLSEMINTPAEIVISGDKALELREELHTHYFPFSVTVGSTNKSELSLLQDREPKNNQTLIYVCRNKTCQLPVSAVADAIKQLNTLNFKN